MDIEEKSQKQNSVLHCKLIEVITILYDFMEIEEKLNMNIIFTLKFVDIVWTVGYNNPLI